MEEDEEKQYRQKSWSGSHFLSLKIKYKSFQGKLCLGLSRLYNKEITPEQLQNCNALE